MIRRISYNVEPCSEKEAAMVFRQMSNGYHVTRAELDRVVVHLRRVKSEAQEQWRDGEISLEKRLEIQTLADECIIQAENYDNC